MSKNKSYDVKTSLKKLRQVLKEVKHQHKKYNATFLVKQDETFIPIKSNDFAYFNSNAGVVIGTTFNEESFTIENNLENLAVQLNPRQFYRLNRQFIVQRNAIAKINYGANGKLVITVLPKINKSLIVSKSKSKFFKNWMAE